MDTTDTPKPSSDLATARAAALGGLPPEQFDALKQGAADEPEPATTELDPASAAPQN